MAEYCVRCGGRDLDDPRFCFWCSDGEADDGRALELIAAGRSGAHDPLRILSDITDPRAFDVVSKATVDDDPRIRRAALIALGGIGDPRGILIASPCLEDAEELVRHAAIEALADLGGGADAIATRLTDPRDRTQAARALAWLHDERAFEPLAMILDSDNLIGESIFGGATIAAMGRLGGAGAIGVLAAAADRVIQAADTGTLEWQARSAASTIAQTLEGMRDPATEPIQARLRMRFDGLSVMPADPAAPFRAPPHPRRTVPRWSFTLQPVTEPVTELVSKFGGQPVWVGEPTWPIELDGGPATFMAQFTIPGRDGLAYLFLDHSNEYPDDPGFVIVQPGPAPERFIPSANGPTFWSEVPGPARYTSRMTLRQVESLAVLEPGFDFDDWSILDADPEPRDDHRDWNKVGGNARWLQNDDTPDEAGWHLSFQFTAASVGRELGDGAEVYGLIHEDGRGRCFIHSH